MGGKYIYRMDDITPDMDWIQFWKFINLFKRHNVKPLLGVVPDNKDSNLSIQDKNKDFWKIIRRLQDEEAVEIAQHGYQHILRPIKAKKILGIETNSLSEFAGLSYDKQLEMIQCGKDILKSKGIDTDIWMAPCHSFDLITLRVLNELGFKKISDGIAVYPFYYKNMLFVPQQIWAPRYFPIGVFTICLHINEASNKRFEEVKKHLEAGADIISFSTATKNHVNKYHNIFNSFFRISYIIRREIKKKYKKISGTNLVGSK